MDMGRALKMFHVTLSHVEHFCALKIEIGLLGSHIARCVVFYWKIDDFGRVEVSRLV